MSTSEAATAPSSLARTSLNAVHRQLGGHMVPFAGWDMPLYYGSILSEHRAVRESCGVFDVSHMGRVVVTGSSAPALLSRRTTADVVRLAPGQCRYTFLLDFEGHIVDDLLITRLHGGGQEVPSFLVVPNAGSAAWVVELLRQHRKPDTAINDLQLDSSLLAIQGPRSAEILKQALSIDATGLRFYHSRFVPVSGGSGAVGGQLPQDLSQHFVLSRTGYTGELGFELLTKSDAVTQTFQRLTEAGAVPCGLGARDTLRLEKGYLLAGQEFVRDHSPLEAGQDRFVEFDHPFVGREALEKQRQAGLKIRLAGVRSDEAGAIPRHGTPVLAGGQLIGSCTSGGLSPSLGAGIALAYLPLELTSQGTRLQFGIRERHPDAHVVSLPFYPESTKKAN